MKPKISRAIMPPFITAPVIDETGITRDMPITGEYPLTLYIDGQEMVTLMTLGKMPEALTIGWLRNQRVVECVEQIEEVVVDWEVNASAVYTRNGFSPLPTRRVITSGCGQGTMFGDLLATVEAIDFERQQPLTATALFNLVETIRHYDTVYKTAGAVHACALSQAQPQTCEVLLFVEDVGRHNAVDAIAGWMWLNDIRGDDKVFYTTGRLTSEMVIKCAQMGIPYLVSRSGITRMGLEVAESVGITMLGRAINKRYLLFTGKEHFNPNL